MIQIAYTANVKRALPLFITILIAIFSGYFVAKTQTRSQMLQLLASPSTTDQLSGIEMLKNESFDSLSALLNPVLSNNSDASRAAQNLLVKRAFHEDRLDDLQTLEIDRKLYETALWWNNETVYKKINFDIEFNPSPWVEKLLAWYPSTYKPTTYTDLVDLPVRDRDGSVLLTVLAINKYAPQKIDPLIHAWEKDYNFERQKAAVLLSTLRNLPFPNISTQNESLATLTRIITENNFQLAWRALHRENGSIDPDVALVAMIIDQDRFMPILIETAQKNLWTHPEHPILIAKTFFGDIANRIPFELLENKETREKWWSLFACGLLQEGG